MKNRNKIPLPLKIVCAVVVGLLLGWLMQTYLFEMMLGLVVLIGMIFVCGALFF